MATVHGKAFQTTVNAVSMEEFMDSVTLNISADTAEVTASTDAAKTFLEGDYTATWDMGGAWDGTDSTGLDETAFGLFGGGAVSNVFIPGSGSVTATNPSYTQSAIQTNYTITASVGDAVRYTRSFQGTGAVTRAES